MYIVLYIDTYVYRNFQSTTKSGDLCSTHIAIWLYIHAVALAQEDACSKPSLEKVLIMHDSIVHTCIRTYVWEFLYTFTEHPYQHTYTGLH